MIQFSVDDTIAIFENLTTGDYTSCFEEPTLSFLKGLHDQYGLKVSMYCFLEHDTGFCLSDATSKFHDEFKEHHEWLRFGFHAKNSTSKYNDYDADTFISEAREVYRQLERIVSSEALTYDVRLGFATGNLACIQALKKQFPLFSTLYGVDDTRIEYYLSPEENDCLLRDGSLYESKAGIHIKLSELRLEEQTDIIEYCKNMQKRPYHAFFTHEIYFGDEKIKNCLTALCKLADGFVLLYHSYYIHKSKPEVFI